MPPHSMTGDAQDLHLFSPKPHVRRRWTDIDVCDNVATNRYNTVTSGSVFYVLTTRWLPLSILEICWEWVCHSRHPGPSWSGRRGGRSPASRV